MAAPTQFETNYSTIRYVIDTSILNENLGPITRYGFTQSIALLSTLNTNFISVQNAYIEARNHLRLASEKLVYLNRRKLAMKETVLQTTNPQAQKTLKTNTIALVKELTVAEENYNQCSLLFNSVDMRAKIFASVFIKVIHDHNQMVAWARGHRLLAQAH